MDGSLLGLLGANALMLVAGLGLVGLRRAAAAYLAGIALCGVLAAELAVLHVPYGWPALGATAAAAVAVRVLRLGRTGGGGLRPTRPGAAAVAAVVLLAALLARAVPAFAVKPLDAYDGWAMWAMKGHALQLFGWADPKLFAGPGAAPLHLDYPLFLPALESLDYRALGAFDTQLVHLQLLLLAVAAASALAWTLRGLAPDWAVWATVAAVATAPNVLLRLLTGYADVPLALLVAVGVASAAGWLVTGERKRLAYATLLLAAAALTKNEGLIFVGACYVGLLAAAPRRWRPILVSAACVELALLPWQVYLRVHDIGSDSTSPLHFHGHLGIAPIALRRLLEMSFSPRQWALLAPLFVLALALAALRRHWPTALFAALWAGLSLGALTWIYVSSSLPYSDYLDASGDRVVSALVLGAAALVPVLVGRPHYHRS